jgi:hypothetical protein
MNKELYDLIRSSITSQVMLDTYEETLFVDKISELATLGAMEYIHDLEESISHLKETIHRLSLEG